MDIRFNRCAVGNLLGALRHAGYFPFRDPKSGEESFVCRLGPDFYPRFHLYAKEQSNTITLSLHLDQKQTSYGGSHMHNGEYEGEVVEREMERIRGWVVHKKEEESDVVTPALNPGIRRNDEKFQNDKRHPWWQFWK